MQSYKIADSDNIYENGQKIKITTKHDINFDMIIVDPL